MRKRDNFEMVRRAFEWARAMIDNDLPGYTDRDILVSHLLVSETMDPFGGRRKKISCDDDSLTSVYERPNK